MQLSYHDGMELDPNCSIARSLGVLERQVTVQAFSLAANDVFWLSGCLFLALLATIWMTRPTHGRPAAASGDAAH